MTETMHKQIGLFKQRALQRADRDGVIKAALDLGMAESMLASWQNNAHLEAELSYLNSVSSNIADQPRLHQ